jgi:hypothetical protein
MENHLATVLTSYPITASYSWVNSAPMASEGDVLLQSEARLRYKKKATIPLNAF